MSFLDVINVGCDLVRWSVDAVTLLNAATKVEQTQPENKNLTMIEQAADVGALVVNGGCMIINYYCKTDLESKNLLAQGKKAELLINSIGGVTKCIKAGSNSNEQSLGNALLVTTATCLRTASEIADNAPDTCKTSYWTGKKYDCINASVDSLTPMLKGVEIGLKFNNCIASTDNSAPNSIPLNSDTPVVTPQRENHVEAEAPIRLSEENRKELDNALKETTKAKAEKQEVEKKLKQANEDLSTTQQKLQAHDEEIEKLNQANEETDRKLKEANEKVEILQSAKDEAEQKLKQAMGKAEEKATQANEEAEQKLKEANAKVEILQKAKDEAEQKLNQAMGKAEQKLTQANIKLETTQEEVRLLKIANDDAAQKLTQANDVLKTAKEEVVNLKQANEVAENKLKQTNDELNTAKKQVEKLEEELSEAKKDITKLLSELDSNSSDSDDESIDSPAVVQKNIVNTNSTAIGNKEVQEQAIQFSLSNVIETQKNSNKSKKTKSIEQPKDMREIMLAQFENNYKPTTNNTNSVVLDDEKEWSSGESSEEGQDSFKNFVISSRNNL